jgi:hypothetical protein
VSVLGVNNHRLVVEEEDRVHESVHLAFLWISNWHHDDVVLGWVAHLSTFINSSELIFVYVARNSKGQGHSVRLNDLGDGGLTVDFGFFDEEIG